MRRAEWECSLCHAPQRPLYTRRVVWRFRCNAGCDYELCRRCMMMTLIPHRDARPGQPTLDSLVTSPVSTGETGDANHFYEPLRSLRDPRGTTRMRPETLAARSREGDTLNVAPTVDHNDTSPGSLHFFEDENGNRVYYRFGDEGGIVSDPTRERSRPVPLLSPPVRRPASRWRESDHQNLTGLPRHRQGSDTPSKRVSAKRIVRVGRFKFALSFDRLWLSHAFDRDTHSAFNMTFTAVLAALSSYVAFEVSDVVGPTATVFVWFAVGTAQYSLVKTVHPDPGTSLVNERGTSYMRCVYFLIFGGLFLAVDRMDPSGGQLLYVIVDQRCSR